MIVINNITLLYDQDFNIDDVFDHLNNLSDDEFDVIHLYSVIIESLLLELELSSWFKFQLPISDNEIWVHLKEKDNILKVLDYLIKHLYQYELYEAIDSFNKLKEYYETKLFH